MPTPSRTAARIAPVKAPTAGVRTAKRVKEAVGNSADLLVSESRSLSEQWGDLEDLGIAANDGVAKAKAGGHHLTVVRAELARQLGTRHVFVGVRVLDDLLDSSVCAGESDSIPAVLQAPNNSKVEYRSLVVFRYKITEYWPQVSCARYM